MKIFDSVNEMGEVLTFHRERHSVLAGNVANVDTPGYKPFDIERLSPMSPGGTALAATRRGHIGTAVGEVSSTTVRSFDDSGTSLSGDGNAVNLERELAKMDANRVRYGAASELVSRRLALLRYAAGDGNG